MSKPEHTFPDLSGMIVSLTRVGKTSYWLVAGPSRPFFSGDAYPMQKCTKTGKLFKDTNGFASPMMEGIANGTKSYDDIKMIRAPGDYAVRKVNNEFGVKVTTLKNRISYLEGCIKEDSRKLELAKAELQKLLD